MEKKKLELQGCKSMKDKNAHNYNFDCEELKRKEKSEAIRNWFLGLLIIVTIIIIILLRYI